MAPFAVIEELATKAEPGLHAMVGPRFFGWVIGASHPVMVVYLVETAADLQRAKDQELAMAGECHQGSPHRLRGKQTREQHHS